MPHVLRPQTSIVWIIDLQEKLVPAMDSPSQLLTANKKLIESAALLEVPVVLSEQMPHKLGATHADLQPSFVSTPPTVMVEKASFNGAKHFAWQEYSQANPQRQQVVIAGVESHICVYQTVRDLLQQGYYVTLAEDAIDSRRVEDYQIGLRRMQQLGAQIGCVESIVFDWLHTAEHPKFKEVQALFK